MKRDHEITVEVFQAGEWQGETFTVEDLDRIVALAEQLYRWLRPALLIGHSPKGAGFKECPAVGLSEQPRIGELKPHGLRPVGDKLLATFTNVPPLAMEAMRKRLYTRVSAQILPDFAMSWTGEGMQRSIPGFVAPSGPFMEACVLGSSIPAVKTLADIQTMLRRSDEDEMHERLRALEANLTELSRRNERVAYNTRLMFAEDGDGTDIAEKFRRAVNDRMNADGADLTDLDLRLVAAQATLRAWFDSPENRTYAHELPVDAFNRVVRETDGSQIGLAKAQGAFGSRTYEKVPAAQTRGNDGLRARQPVTATFPNRAPTASAFAEAQPGKRPLGGFLAGHSPELHGLAAMRARHDAEAREARGAYMTLSEHGAPAADGRSAAARIAELSGIFAMRRPDLVPNYARQAVPVAPIPEGLTVMLNDAFAKLPAGSPDRLGKAMRAATAEAPPQWLPTYGRRQ